MKRIIYSMGLMLMTTFALTDCTKEMNHPQEEIPAGTPFEIVASAVGTRTTNDGIHTDWEAGDTINLFHAPASTTGYVNDNIFTIAEEDLAEGRFKGTLASGLEAGKSYDWYAFYPYNSHTQAPTNNDEDSRKNGFNFIGHSKGLNQYGYDNMSSLCGTVCPLYGLAENVASDKMPQVTMQHLSSVIALKVTNTADAPLVVETASFTAPEDIVGQYYISFAGEPAYTPRGEANVKNTAVVNVSNGTELAKNQSAVLYLAIKPFTAKSGDKLYISVNGYEKELPLTKDVTFTAGKIKTVNFAYDYVKTSKEVVFDFTNPAAYGITPSEEVSKGVEIPESVTDGGITITHVSNSQNKVCIWTNTDKSYEMRAYNTDAITFTVPEGYVIKKLTFVGTAADAAISPNIGSYSSKEWTGNANPLVLDIKDGLKLRTITVEYDLGESDPEKAVQNLSFAEANYTATLGEAFESPVLEGAQTAVTYSSSEESVATVDESGKVTILKEGKTTITATAAENDTYRSAQASYTLTVNEPFTFPWNEDFSAADVISKYTVTSGGTESKIYNQNTAGGEAPEIMISSGNGSLTAKIQMGDDYGEMALTLNSNNPGYLSVTSTVAGVVIGEPVTDNNAKTFEVAITVPQGTDVLDLTITNTSSSSNTRVDNISFNKAKAKQTLSFAEAAYSLTIGDAFTAPTVSGAKTLVTYSSDYDAVASVDPSTGAVTLGSTAGTATITATAAETDDYRSATASYTITLDVAGTKTVTYTFTSKAWACDPAIDSWKSNKDGYQLTSGRGVQVSTKVTGAGATCNQSFANVQKIIVVYSTNKSDGAGNISFAFGENQTKSLDVTKVGGITDRELVFDYTSSPVSGSPTMTVNCTTNSIYVRSVTIVSEN